MQVSEALNILRHCPGGYPLEAEIDGQPHQILALEYSHEPARALLKATGSVAIALSAVDAVREISTHKVNPANDTITLVVLDGPGAGGASHEYLAAYTDKTGFPHQTRISFQNGPIAINGVNGLTQEVLLAIVVDRLESFQRGPFACKDNEDALQMIKGGLTCLLKRTRARMAQGVEGTHEKHVEPVPAPLPEPEATIAELNAATAPAPVAGETFGEAYVAPVAEQPAPPKNLAVPSVVSDAEAVAAAEQSGTAAPKSAPSIKRHRAKKEASE